MTSAEAHQVVRRMLGWWATPPLTDEEALGWVEELTSPVLAIAPDEALTALRKTAHAGRVHRPRPGEIIAAVQAERRAQARITDTSKMLAESRAGAVSPERVSKWVRTCHRALAGEDIEEAKIAEGIAS
jgi:hypothetical protein